MPRKSGKRVCGAWDHGKHASRRDVGLVRAGRNVLAYVRGVAGVCEGRPFSFATVCQSRPVPGVVADQKSNAELSISVGFRVVRAVVV